MCRKTEPVPSGAIPHNHKEPRPVEKLKCGDGPFHQETLRSP